MRVLCVGNGGVVVKKGAICTHRSDVSFVTELAAQAAKVTYIGWRDSTDDPLSHARMPAQVRARALTRIEGKGVRSLAIGARALAALIGEVRRADVVYIFWPGRLAIIVAALCRLIRRPYGIYFRGEVIESDATFTRAFSGASFVIAAGEELRRRAMVYCQDVDVVTPMTAVGREHLLPPKRHSAPEVWRILFVGRVERRKGSHDLVAAIAELQRRGIPSIATLVGHCADLDGFMRSLPPAIEHVISMPGAVIEFDRLAEHYRAADLFVFPSHDEGFPRVLYEAMAFGLPIITTFVGSIPTLMTDGVNCLRIDVGDPADIAEKVTAIVRSATLYDSIAAGGSATIARQMKTWKLSHAEQVWHSVKRYATRQA